MNLNPIFEAMPQKLGYPVEQDMYQGDEKIYAVYCYTDERGEVYGNNKPLIDKVYMRLQLYTPQNYNYMSLKHKTRDYLESQGFRLTSIRTWLEDGLDNEAEKIRCTAVDMEYAGAH